MGKTSGKSKMVVKQCPECERQMPVASKRCQCGYAFFSKRAQLPSEDGDEDGGVFKRRRTERVKRERPDFYSASEYENQLRRARMKEKEEAGSKKKKKHKRGRPKGSQNKTAEEIEEEREKDLYSNISRDKAFVYAVVLAEINERIVNQTWKPPSPSLGLGPGPSPGVGQGKSSGPDIASSSRDFSAKRKGKTKT